MTPRVEKRRKPIAPGTLVKYLGRPWRVGMVGITQGERYYWLKRALGEVAMIPGYIVEAENP